MKVSHDKKEYFINKEKERAAKEIHLLEKEIVGSNENDGKDSTNNVIIKYLETALASYNLMVNAVKGQYSNINYITTIIEKLANGIPLTPIYGDDEEWGELPYTDIKNGVTKKYVNKRLNSLFKEVYEDGSIKYRDSGRLTCVNFITEVEYYFGLANLIYDEMFPITMPYNVMDEIGSKIYTHDFLSDQNKKGETDFDTVVLLYIEKENGEKIRVDRYFREPNEGEEPTIGSWVEIDGNELVERIKAARSNLDAKDLAYRLEDDSDWFGIKT